VDPEPPQDPHAAALAKQQAGVYDTALKLLRCLRNPDVLDWVTPPWRSAPARSGGVRDLDGHAVPAEHGGASGLAGIEVITCPRKARLRSALVGNLRTANATLSSSVIPFGAHWCR
jgi:hypothetical protein